MMEFGLCSLLFHIFTAIFPLDLEVIIRAVIIKDLIISLTKEMAVFIDFRLNKITFRAENIQCSVHIMELVGRFL